MARGLRIHVPDGWYHIMSRGNGGEAIYRTEDDRRRFLGLVAELAGRFGTEVHAFVLMDNHYHLLVRCRQATVSETLRWLQTAYAIRFNWAHRRRGHVFQGRFKSVLIRDDGALDRVGGAVLGERGEARALLRAAAREPGAPAKRNREEWVLERPEWGTIVAAAEKVLGRRWEAMAERYGDWGRDGTMAVATRELGWRMVEVVKAVGGIEYAAAAQGVRGFWKWAAERNEMAEFAKRLPAALAKCR
jgi:REP element-mobilizing transposase RayT